METLESERICRLCAEQLDDTMAICIFNNQENYEKKIRTTLPIMIHEMDYLPKYLCYDCSNKLKDFYNFYIETLRMDIKLKNQLSWMKNKPEKRFDITPTVSYVNLKLLKIESEMEEEMKNMFKKKSVPKFDDCLEPHKNMIKDKTNYSLVTFRNRQKKDLNSTEKISCNSREYLEYEKKEFLSGDNSNQYDAEDKVPLVLIRDETKKNEKSIRRLRPRRKMIDGDTSTDKKVKYQRLNNYTKAVINSRRILNDSQLSKNVKIRTEKLNSQIITPNVQIKLNKRSEISFLHRIRSLRSQNNHKRMEEHQSEDVNPKFVEDKLAQLKQNNKRAYKNRKKKRNKRSGSLRGKYKCRECNELFSEKELHKLHYCYYH